MRILGTELSQDDYGNRYMQFSELELLAGDTKRVLSGVRTSSDIPGWPTERLIDGDGKGWSTWSSRGHNDHLASSEWAAVLLPSRMAVDRLRITPRANPVDAASSLGFPKDFVIQYAYNGDGLTCSPADARFAQAGNWKPLITRFGFDQPSNESIDFQFSSAQAECARILGTELSQDDYGNRYMQFTELELYAAP